MTALRPAWLAATLGAAACVESVNAPGKCPEFCPNGSIQVVDTLLATNISRDSAYRGYVFAHRSAAMFVADVPGVVQSRAILLATPLGPRVVLGADTTSSPIVGSDSVKLKFVITRRDTTAHDLTLKLYRLLPPTIDSTTTFVDLENAFTDSLRAVNIDSVLAKPGGIDSTTGDQVAIDTASKRLTVTLKLDSLQAPYVPDDSGKLAVGIRVSADRPVSIALSTNDNTASGGASISWFVKVDSIKDADTTLVHKSYPSRTIRFDSFIFDPPPAPLDSTLAVGGVPSARSLLRINLPRAIRDSSQIIRATLILVPAVAARGAPGDSFEVEAHTVLADFGAKSPIALDQQRTDTTLIRIGANATVRIEVTNLVQFWAADTLAPTALMLRAKDEGVNPAEIRFYPSAAPAYRPSLRLTYARRFPFGKP